MWRLSPARVRAGGVSCALLVEGAKAGPPGAWSSRESTRGRRAGVFWSSLSFKPKIHHAPSSLQVAFRMPIPLARDEMVTFALPGFRRDGGSGFFSGGPAVDNDYRLVTVRLPTCVDRGAPVQCVPRGCPAVPHFDVRSVGCEGRVRVCCAGCTGIRAQKNYSLPPRSMFRRGIQSLWNWPVQQAFTSRRLGSQQTAASSSFQPTQQPAPCSGFPLRMRRPF